jgi:anti-sigma factor RsiW
MSGPVEGPEDSALWRRWRAAVDAAGAAPLHAPDPLLLAAYAEGRLDEPDRDAVEAWLAAYPDAIDDLLAARRLGRREAEWSAVSEAALARASGLVRDPDPQVLPFRQPVRRAPLWRAAIAWGGMAASIAATGLVGFVLGSEAYATLSGGTTIAASQDVFDPPSGFLTGLGEESET